MMRCPRRLGHQQCDSSVASKLRTQQCQRQQLASCFVKLCVLQLSRQYTLCRARRSSICTRYEVGFLSTALILGPMRVVVHMLDSAVPRLMQSSEIGLCLQDVLQDQSGWLRALQQAHDLQPRPGFPVQVRSPLTLTLHPAP